MFPSSSSCSTTLAGAFILGSTVVFAAQNYNNPLKKLAHRSLTTDVSDVSGETFDFVIAGGGVAGLALAARLTEWSNLTVAVIEAGATGEESQFVDHVNIPGYSYLNGLAGTDYDWKYTTEVQPNANDTTKYWPRGKGLGGSGAINGLFWVRGSSVEYDAWNTLNPDSTVNWGWSGDDGMQHYINKAENFTAPRADQTKEFGIYYNTSIHGTHGPIQAGFCAYMYKSVAEWVPTWKALGLSAVDGHSGNNHGVSITPMTLNPSNQTRSDSKAGYIDPLPPRSNLVILTGYQATRVTFNGSTDTNGSAIASGLEFMSTSGGATGTKYTVSVNKEVILSGGVVGSPQILQLSGVGPKSLLTGLGIDVVQDLPVGYNLQDHISTAVDYSVPSGTLVWGNLYNAVNASAQLALYEAGDYENSQWSFVNQANGYVSMADITNDYKAFASTAVSDLDTDVETMTTASSIPDSVAAGYKAQYEINNQWLTEDVGQLEIIMTMLGGTTGVGVQAGLQHPYSRGTIMINSTSAFDKPLINPNYYGIAKDIEILQYGITFARKIAATSPMSSVMIKETTPGLAVIDTALTTWIKTSSGTEYHPLGSCSMQPKANGGVVDTSLIVHGTSNLRVVDASIMPLQISAHLMASTYGIAEKAADLIKAKHAAYIAPTVSSSISSSKTATASGSSASASGSSASNGKVVGGNVGAATTSSAMSSGTRNAVVGAVVGGLGALALGLIAFFVMRKKKNASRAAKTQSFYVGAGPEDDTWETGYHNDASYAAGGAAAAGAGGSMRLDTIAGRSTENLGGMVPPPALLGRGERSQSVSSMATQEMSGAQPMVPGSPSGGGGWYQPAATNESYHDAQDYVSSPTRSLSPNPQGRSTSPGEFYRPRGQAHYAMSGGDQHGY